MGAAEAAPRGPMINQDSAAKQHGFPVNAQDPQHTREGKRSYRRACARAQRSQQGARGTEVAGLQDMPLELRHQVGLTSPPAPLGVPELDLS